MRPTIHRSPLAAAALAVALVAGLALAASPAHAASDLRITSMTVDGTARVGACNKVNMTVRNDGDAFTDEATIDLRVITFPTATPNQNRAEKDSYVSPLQPGGQWTFSVQNVDFKAAGTATLQAVVDWTQEVPEGNEINNTSTLQTTVSGVCFAPPPPTSTTSACDLAAQFTTPSGVSAPAGIVDFVVRFSNAAKATCPGNKIKLMRYNSSRCSGYGTQIGGSRNLQELNPLSTGQTQDIAFADKVAKGQYCYKVVYSSAHNDTNNFNHHPTKGLVVQ